MEWNSDLEQDLNYELYEDISCVLDQMTMEEIIPIHNNFLEKIKCSYDIIYKQEKFNELFNNLEPLEILRQFKHTNILNNDYFWFDVGGNLIADDNASPIDIDNIAEYCVEHNEDFNCEEIKEILKSKQQRKIETLEALND